MSENIQEYTSEDVTPEALAGEGLVLVDFWATWCGPCRMLAPILEKLSETFENVLFAKVNVDENPEACIQYGITSIPLLILFKDGEIVEKSVGYQPQSVLEDMIRRHL